MLTTSCHLGSSTTCSPQTSGQGPVIFCHGLIPRPSPQAARVGKEVISPCGSGLSPVLPSRHMSAPSGQGWGAVGVEPKDPALGNEGTRDLSGEGGGGGSSSEGSIHGIPEWAAAGTNPGHQSGRASSEVRAWLCQGQQCPVVPLFLNSCATHLAEGLRVWEGVWAQPGQEDYLGGRRVYHDGTDARLGRKEGEGPACLRVRVEDGLWALKYVCARTVSGCLSVGTWVPCSHRRLCAPGMSRLSG